MDLSFDAVVGAATFFKAPLFTAPLLAATAGGIDWAWWWHLTQGILALGLVILIHEFGHFAAAKLCGVRVDQFFIGFGPRLWSIKRGETEYGIRILPLGGFVSMFGQTDDPGKQAEEVEHAKSGQAVVVGGGEPLARKTEDGRIVWHPRSYPAQTVPERMFIISAGVILNAITGFLFAACAYLMGAEFTPTAVHALQPSGAAWQRDVRIGDEIIQIDGVREPRFEADLRARVALADLNKGLNLQIARAGREPFDLNVVPHKMRPDFPPTLGISGPRLTTLQKSAKGLKPTLENSPARAAKPEFEAEDEIVQIEDVEINGYPDIVRALTLYADKPIKVYVRRTAHTGGDAATTEVMTTIEPRKMRTLGLVMQWGPVTAVQDNSPAAAVGIVPGDKLKSIDGEPPGDPITAAERLRQKQKAAPDKKWKVTLERLVDGKPQEITLDVLPREADYYEQPILVGRMSLPTLGVAYSVPPIVAEVLPGSPADTAGLKPGDVVTQFKTLPTDEPLESGEPPKSFTQSLLDDDAENWAVCALALSELRGSTKVELSVKPAGSEETRSVTLEPIDSATDFYPERGLLFQSPKFLRKADSLGQALEFAWTDTRDAMTQVYRFLHAMFIGQIPTKAVGGVITIAQQAGDSASGGLAQLLLFLMMLSCNLAVLNFLPFPVLDGGHMVLLAYEGIFRRPPPERFVTYLMYVGLACLLFLMGYALKNDLFRIFGLN